MINIENEYSVMGVSRIMRRNVVIGIIVLLLSACSGLVSALIFVTKQRDNEQMERLKEKDALLKEKDETWGRALKQAELNGDKLDGLSARALFLLEQNNELKRQLQEAQKRKR